MHPKIAMQLMRATLAPVRAMLAPYNVCIYPVSCGDYAREMLQQRMLPVALIKIGLRLLSCNPIYYYFVLRRK